jgi:hypothetical protein
MAEVIAPQTPEEAAALRALEAKHQRQRRGVALFANVVVSFYARFILGSLWHGWLLEARTLGLLAYFVMSAAVSMVGLARALRGQRAAEATDRQWTVLDVRWRAQERAWRDQGAESRGQPREGHALHAAAG